MLVAAGLLGTAMNQRAYQLAPISYSMPMVNVVDIMVAVLFGAVVFGELPAPHPGHARPAVVSAGLRRVSACASSRLWTPSAWTRAPRPIAAGQLR